MLLHRGHAPLDSWMKAASRPCPFCQPRWVQNTCCSLGRACDQSATALHTQVQKDALDRRLSLRQHSDSAGALNSTAVSHKNRGRKIAPTMVQPETNAIGFPALSSQSFSSPQSQLLAEASARDLCTRDHEPGELSQAALVSTK